MERARLLAVGLALAVTTAGCTQISYRVIPSGPGITAPAKPSDCPMLFLRTGSARPYDEMCAIHLEGFLAEGGAEEAQRLLGVKACELGADAIIVTEDYRMRSGGFVMISGVAIKFKDTSPSR